eukprot:3848297-Rhodomonas_salina.1
MFAIARGLYTSSLFNYSNPTGKASNVTCRPQTPWKLGRTSGFRRVRDTESVASCSLVADETNGGCTVQGRNCALNGRGRSSQLGAVGGLGMQAAAYFL